MKHDYFTPKDISPDDNWGQLNIVDGGLALCKVCGGMEGSLTTDCPGEKIPFDQDQKVYRGEIDYVEGKGWVDKASMSSPAFWSNVRRI
ncbi:MAG: hypothetical protein K0Q73_5955 [Paenibacillus sp.]|jgi:hypothetical protein|nr:hypothetical protein [Paenibacillus sp.]